MVFGTSHGVYRKRERENNSGLGLALRQIGWGRKVLFLQFMKGPGNVVRRKKSPQSDFCLTWKSSNGDVNRL